jgi:REP element-mobilizing transposase RayT
MAYNPHIHHRKSIRLKGYDYSQAGLYFITICANRECLFGKIVVGAEYFPPDNDATDTRWAEKFLPDNHTPSMKLTDAGKIANTCWLEIPNHFPNVVLHEHIVMPNHVHGIIELTDIVVGAEKFLPNNDATDTRWAGNIPPNNNFPPQYYNRANNFPPLMIRANNNSPQLFKSPTKTIGSIIRGYKIGVTKWFRSNTNIETVWQRNYYEHIIRNEQSYQTISKYILNNPAKWKGDKFYSLPK